jgi:hypothetical protein
MPSRALPVDLLGKRIRQRRPRYEAAIKRADLRAVPVRAERIRWVAKAIPRNTGFLMPMDTYYVFEEAKSCFIYGQFVATVVMSVSFIEHWLAGKLHNRGLHRESSSGLAAMVACARKKGFVAEVILDRIDSLRLKRNPFAHLKEMNHEHSLGARSVSQGRHPVDVLEEDAREALALMYAVALYTFREI